MAISQEQLARIINHNSSTLCSPKGDKKLNEYKGAMNIDAMNADMVSDEWDNFSLSEPMDPKPQRNLNQPISQNAVNNSRMCAWYARNLEEVVELYCIYNHLTSDDYEYILSDYEIDYKGVKVNGLSNFKEMCLKESNSTNKLTATAVQEYPTDWYVPVTQDAVRHLKRRCQKT